MDVNALEQTARRYGDSIYRIALQYTGLPADAEDVLQEVLLERYRTDRVFASEEHERRSHLRVAENKSKNVIRGRRCWKTAPLDEAAKLYAPAGPSYRGLYDAVRSLPRSQRMAVDLFYYEGYSNADKAAILNDRETTVRTWLRRARLKLKELLKEEWDDE